MRACLCERASARGHTRSSSHLPAHLRRARPVSLAHPPTHTPVPTQPVIGADLPASSAPAAESGPQPASGPMGLLGGSIVPSVLAGASMALVLSFNTPAGTPAPRAAAPAPATSPCPWCCWGRSMGTAWTGAGRRSSCPCRCAAVRAAVRRVVRVVGATVLGAGCVGGGGNGTACCALSGPPAKCNASLRRQHVQFRGPGTSSSSSSNSSSSWSQLY